MPAMSVAPSRIEPQPVMVFMTSFMRCDASAEQCVDLARDQLSVPCDLLRGPEHVVAQVLELLGVLGADPHHVAVTQLGGDLLHRLHLVLELDELAADVEELTLQSLGRSSFERLGAEDALLDRLDPQLDLAGSDQAVIDACLSSTHHTSLPSVLMSPVSNGKKSVVDSARSALPRSAGGT